MEEIYLKILDEKLDDNTIILIMADHGMGIGEKIGERAYGIFTYDYCLRTFAYFIQPKIFPKGKEISGLTRTIDVMPTILDLLEIPIDKSCLTMQGENLLNSINQSTTDEDSEFNKIAFSETGGLLGPWPSPDSPNVECVRTEKWKLVHNLTPETWELYNLKDDPQETKNLVNKYPIIVKKLKDKLQLIIDECADF